MVTSFKINGRRVAEVEFRAVEEALTGACGTPAFSDKHLTRKEALKLLTRGQKQVSAPTVARVCKLYEIGYRSEFPDYVLSRCGISIGNLASRSTFASALRQNSDVWYCATPQYRRDPELAVMAMQNGADSVFHHLPIQLKRDPYLALQSLAYHDEAYFYLPGWFLSNETFMRAAIAIDAHTFQYAPARLRQDRDIVMNAVSQDGRMLVYADPKFWEDRDVVHAALKGLNRPIYDSHDFFDVLFSNYWNDPELMLSAALEWPSIFLGHMKEVGSPLLQDKAFVSVLKRHWKKSPNFLPALFNITNGRPYWDDITNEAQELIDNPDYFEQPPRSGDIILDDNRPNQDAVVQRLGQWFDFVGMTYPARMFDNYAAYRLGIQDITQFPKRFDSVQSMIACWHNRNTLNSDQDRRPIVLALYPMVDHNDAFENPLVINSLLNNDRFRVIYQEVSSDTEAEAVIKNISKNGRRPIHTLVLAGHGLARLLNWGAPESEREFREEHYLDVSDFQERMPNAWQALGRYLANDGNVVLYSCSNGYGGTGSDNLANAVASVVPRSVTIYSSTLPSNIRNLVVTPDLKLLVEWKDRSNYNPSGQQPE